MRVIYPESMREQSTSLNSLPIILATGQTVYLNDVADISIGRGLNQIRRRDSQRMAKITADVDTIDYDTECGNSTDQRCLLENIQINVLIHYYS